MSAYKRFLAGAAASLLMMATVSAQDSPPDEEDDTEEPSTDPLPEDEPEDPTPEDEPDVPPTAPTGNAAVEYEDLCSDDKPALYMGDCQTLKDPKQYQAYTPKFGLWADGEDKERFIYLPGDINTNDPSAWKFPTGTILYKTFKSKGGQRYETRIIKKKSETEWSLKTWGWKSDGTAQTDIPKAELTNWQGTGHNIPTSDNCTECHRGANKAPLEPILGFTAVQLNHHGQVINDDGQLVSVGGVTLSSLGLSSLEAPAAIPGDDTAQKALGYMNANCAHCHGGPNPAGLLDLSLSVGLTRVEGTPAFKNAVCQDLQFFPAPAAQPNMTKRIDIEAIEASAILWRMQQRTAGQQMPRIATTQVHPVGVSMVRDWIKTIQSCPSTTVP